MAKNIVVCSDGTGQSANGHVPSNVVRLCRLLDYSGSQICGYDAGVGTVTDETQMNQMRGFMKDLPEDQKQKLTLFNDKPESLTEKVSRFPGLYKINVLLGKGIGAGLKKNVMQLYKYLVENYDGGLDGNDSDRIYLFGFSRGAFTVRVVAGLLFHCGLLKQWDMQNFSKAWQLYEPYYDVYEDKEKFKSLMSEVSEFKAAHSRDVRIHFLGVWDTVKSYGYILPKRPPWTRHNPIVNVVRHALSIDEHRKFYEPTSWGWRDLDGKQGCPGPSDTPKEQDVKEVWFSGDHADVGGGHDDGKDHLSNIALKWMLNEAASSCLKIDKKKYLAELANINPDRNDAGFKRHSELAPDAKYGKVWSAVERYMPRKNLINCPLPPTTQWIRLPTGQRKLVESLRYSELDQKTMIWIHDSVAKFYDDKEIKALLNDTNIVDVGFVTVVEHVSSKEEHPTTHLQAR
jgi:uncharacterized protein (DUF2235 family)